jgi:hypothetical protein
MPRWMLMQLTEFSARNAQFSRYYGEEGGLQMKFIIPDGAAAMYNGAKCVWAEILRTMCVAHVYLVRKFLYLYLYHEVLNWQLMKDLFIHYKGARKKNGITHRHCRDWFIRDILQLQLAWWGECFDIVTKLFIKKWEIIASEADDDVAQGITLTLIMHLGHVAEFKFQFIPIKCLIF